MSPYSVGTNDNIDLADVHSSSRGCPKGQLATKSCSSRVLGRNSTFIRRNLFFLVVVCGLLSSGVHGQVSLQGTWVFELLPEDLMNAVASATWFPGQQTVSLTFDGCALLDFAKDSTYRCSYWGPHANYRLADIYLCGGPTPTQANTCTQYCTSGWGCESWVVNAPGTQGLQDIWAPKPRPDIPISLQWNGERPPPNCRQNECVNLTLTILKPSLALWSSGVTLQLGQYHAWPNKNPMVLFKVKARFVPRVEVLDIKPKATLERLGDSKLTPEQANETKLAPEQPGSYSLLSKREPMAQLIQMVNLTHAALNLVNPDLARDCWICMTPGPLRYVGLAVNSSATLPASQASTDALLMAPVPIYGNSPILTGSKRVCAPNHTALACSHGVFSCVVPGNNSCQIVSLLPNLSLIPGSQAPSLPDRPQRYKRSVVPAIPLAVDLLATVEATLEAMGSGLSQAQYQVLTEQIITDFGDLTHSALASLILQNRRDLALLTAARGGLCLYLQDRCCFYTNKSGVVRETQGQLQYRINERRGALSPSAWWDSLENWLPWISPFIGLLVFLLLMAAVGPCLFKALTRFIDSQIAKVILQPLLTQGQALEEELLELKRAKVP